MKPIEAEQLLGGHATGTLTVEERQTLYAAALGHQAIFDALMDEEILRDLLADPEAKAQLLAALATAPPKVVPFWRRTGVLGAAAGLLMAATAGLVVLRSPDKVPPPSPQEASKAPVAKVVETQAAAPPAAPVREQVPGTPAKAIAATVPAAAAPLPPLPPLPMPAPPAAGVPASNLADGSRAQAEFRRAEAQDKLARKAEAPRPTALAMMEATGALAPAPSAPPPIQAMAKAKASGAARQDAAPVPGVPRWALETQADGSTRVTITASRGAQVVLLRRRATGVDALLPRATGESGTALVLWRTDIRLAAGDVLDLYVLSAPVADPTQLPATGPVDGYRVRIHPAPKN